MEILESPFPQFGKTLFQERQRIERYFANLTNWGGSLTHLPAWVRTYQRVYRWVQAKLLINAVQNQLMSIDAKSCSAYGSMRTTKQRKVSLHRDRVRQAEPAAEKMGGFHRKLVDQVFAPLFDAS